MAKTKTEDGTMSATIRRKNHVMIEGYLKENLLELVKTPKEAIRGSVTIAVDELNSHKVQFYVNRLQKDGSECKEWKDLMSLLPSNTITIASYLKQTPTANFQNAANSSTKLWVTGYLEEYATKEDDKERSVILIKGRRAAFKTISERYPFTPRAEFSCDVYIESKRPEMNADSSESGRIFLTGLLPVYNGSMYRIVFVAPVEGDIAAYVQDNYEVGQTVSLNGDLISTQVSKPKTGIATGNFFGRSNEQQYETTFIRERRIMGGSAKALDETDPGAITKKEAKDGLATREEKMIEAGERRKGTRPIGAGSAPRGFTNKASDVPSPISEGNKSGFDCNDF